MTDRFWVALSLLGIVLAIAWPVAAMGLLALSLIGLSATGQFTRALRRLAAFLIPVGLAALLRWYWGNSPTEVALKMLAIFAAGLHLTARVPPPRVVAVLVSWRLPFASILALSLRYVEALSEEARTMHATMKLRGGFSSPRRSFHTAGLLAGSLIVKGFDRAVATTDSMLMRGGRP